MVQKIIAALNNNVNLIFIITIIHQEFWKKPESTVKALQQKNLTSSYFDEKASSCLFINKTIISDIPCNLTFCLNNAHN